MVSLVDAEQARRVLTERDRAAREPNNMTDIRCRSCQEPTKLTRSVRDGSDLLRAFECPKCMFIQTDVVKSGEVGNASLPKGAPSDA